jgi:hypothetical protein
VQAITLVCTTFEPDKTAIGGKSLPQKINIIALQNLFIFLIKTRNAITTRRGLNLQQIVQKASKATKNKPRPYNQGGKKHQI